MIACVWKIQSLGNCKAMSRPVSLILCFCVNTIFCDSAGFGPGLYATVGKYDLGKYDLSNGSLTTVARAEIPFTSKTGENIGCIDNVHGIYYMIYQVPTNKTYTGLYPYNLIDPTVKYEPIKLTMIYPNDVIGADDICVSDANTGDVYISGKDRQLKHTVLIKVSYSNDKFSVATIGDSYEINTHQDAEPGHGESHTRRWGRDCGDACHRPSSS